MSQKEKKLNSERLQRVIDLCQSVEERGVDPFALDVDEIIAMLRKYFREWESPEELTLDAEAIKCLASVIKDQGEWVKHRSTSLYRDPFLFEEKLQRLNKEEFAELFREVWNPIVELEQLSIPSLTEGLKYWQQLLPLSERWQQNGPLVVEAGATTREELVRLRILAEKTFLEELETFWKELKKKVGEAEKILYWDFVGADTYSETMDRAYMTSFLITYGYATLELHPLEEEVFIKPFAKQIPKLTETRAVSVAVSVSSVEWMKWKEGRHG